MTKPVKFLSLAELAAGAEQPAKPFRICIATPDLLGAVKNGGIGTACGYLAYKLAEAGHDVHVLFCQARTEDYNDSWREEYQKRGIATANAADFVDAEGDFQIFPDAPQMKMSRVVYEWLKRQPDFDMVLFMDWQGAGFYSMHAKACGLDFADTVLAVFVHSPSYWHSVYNAALPENPVESCMWHIERQSIAMADAVVSASQYMLGWINERVCRLPEQSYYQPYIIDADSGFVHASDAPIREVVFFGRLEFRKGLEQFCSALDRLAIQGKLPPKVTFMGKCSWLGNEHSALYIAKRSKNWKGCKIGIETQKGQRAAMEYLCAPGRMAVMPSTADNSPCTVYECLGARIPFLARNVGGIAEILPPEQRDQFLFGDNPAELAWKIAACVGRPPRRGAIGFDENANIAAWKRGLPLLTELVKRNAPKGNGQEKPFISVILTHYNRPQLLRQAVESFFAQDYDNFEVILADDGSTEEKAIKFLNELEPKFQRRGWRILRLKNGFPPAARNRGAEVAKGDWLIFFDDDNIAMPHMMSVCAKAAANRQGGYIPMMFQVFESQHEPDASNFKEIFLPTGNAIAYSIIHNTLADTTALVSKKSFNAVGGFREDYGVGQEDFELYLRMALHGEPVAILPRPLFWYRKSPDKTSVQLNTNAALSRMRSLRPFLELLPPPLAELALMSHGMAHTLNLFSDPGRGDFMDLPLDIKAEPNSPQVLIQAVNILAAQGHATLANQLLRSLPAAEQPVRSALICARAAALARKGDLKGAWGCVEEFDALELEPEEIASVCAAILDNLSGRAGNLRADICARLDSLEKRNPLGCMLLARENAEKNDADAAIRYFMEGLVLADSAYQKGRPDVEQAVKSKAFICGLQHFALHGLIDKAQWPEKQLFAEFLARYPELEPKIMALHMMSYRYDDPHVARQIIESLKFGNA